MAGHHVLIGSGVSSLALGTYLLQAGHRVTILERRPDSEGGYMGTVSVAGMPLSWGPRYLFEFEPGRPGEQVLRDLGLADEISFRSLNPSHFNRIFVGSAPPIDVPISWKAYERLLLSRFPGEAAAVSRFFAQAARLYPLIRHAALSDLHLLPPLRALPRLLTHREIGLRGALRLGSVAAMTLDAAFEDCRCSDALRAVLSGHVAVMAETPRDLSLIGYIGATMSYHQGAAYPTCGIEGMLRAMVKRFTACGGILQKGAQVVGFQMDHGRLTRARLADGRIVPGDRFISGVDPRATIDFLPPRNRFRLPGYEAGMSTVCYFMSVRVPESVRGRLDNSNVWILKNDRIFSGKSYSDFTWDDTLDYLYLNSPTLFAEPDAPHSRLALTAFSPMGFEICSTLASADAIGYQREVGALKKRFAEKVAGFLGFDASTGVEGLEAMTPVDAQQILGAPRGASLATRRTNADMLWRRISMRTPIPNLFFCSAYTSYAGISFCLQGARHLAHLIATLD